MAPKLKAKWLLGLRSGRFKQGDSLLYDAETKSFCCLGVLCRVAGARLEEIDDHTMPVSTKRFETVIDFRVASELAGLNDAGVPFEMIAGLIDAAL